MTVLINRQRLRNDRVIRNISERELSECTRHFTDGFAAKNVCNCYVLEGETETEERHKLRRNARGYVRIRVQLKPIIIADSAPSHDL